MVSRSVLVLGPLLCVWAQLRPFSWSRALIGDAAAPALVILLGLACIGLGRERVVAADRAEHGPAAWVRFAAEKPGVVFVLVLAAMSGNAPAFAPNAAIVLTGIAWLAAGAARRVRGGGPRFAARLDAVTGAVLFAAPFLFASFAGRGFSALGSWAEGAKLAAGLAVLVPGLVLLFASRSDRELPPALRRGCLSLAIPALLLFLTGPVMEIPSNLDFAVYAGLPATWVALYAAGLLARAAAGRAGRLDAETGAIRFGRVLVPTQAWSAILAAQLAARIANPWSSVVVFGLSAFVVLIAIGWGMSASSTKSAAPGPSSIRGVERALLPLLAPTLAFAILHALPNHDRWSQHVAPRGQVAVLLEALPVPLLGAAIVLAFAIDRASGRRACVAVPLLGTALLAGCLATYAAPQRYERFAAWFGTPEQIAHVGLQAVYGPVALLVALATGIGVLRLLSAARGRRPSILVLAVPIVVAFALANQRLPIDGPVAAVESASVGLGAWLLLEAVFALRFGRVA